MGPWSPAALASVRQFVFAGAAPPVSMIEAIRAVAQPGVLLQTGWGMTETCGFLTFTKPEDGDDVHATTLGAFLPGEGFDWRLVSDDGLERDVSTTGEIGELRVKATTLFSHYLNLPEKTAEAFDADGWFRTSDMMRLEAPTGHLLLVGRTSDMFKTGGENVYPREVEAVIEEHSTVAVAAVVGVPDRERYGEVGVAFVQLQGADASGGGAAASEASIGELRAFCKRALSNFKVPKEFHVLPALPLLPNGKVNKAQLKELAVARPGGG